MNIVDSGLIAKAMFDLVNNYQCEIHLSSSTIFVYSVDRFGETILEVPKGSDYIITELDKIKATLTPRRQLTLVGNK